MRTQITTFIVTAAAAVTLIAAPAAAQHGGGGHSGGGHAGGGHSGGGHATGGGGHTSSGPTVGHAGPRARVALPHLDQRRTVVVRDRAHLGVGAFGLGLGAYGYASRYGYPSYGYGYPGYYSGYSSGYYGGYSSGYYGGSVLDGHARLRLLGAPRDAEVYVDGYYAGIVNDFDGVFQHLELRPGAHQIEIRAAGFAPIVFDVQAVGGRTITYRAQMAPYRP